MEHDPFTQRIESVQRRVNELRHCADTDLRQQPTQLAGMLDELSTALGELRCQNQQLAAAHADLEQRMEQRATERLDAHQALRAEIAAHKLVQQALVERERLAALGADVATALTESGTLRTMLQDCAKAIVRQLDAAFARIWTVNRQGSLLELQASAGMYTHIDGTHSRVPVGQFKIGWIAQQRQPHLTNTVIGDLHVHDQEWAKREGMVAFAGYPLILDDRLVGVMAMFARKPLEGDTLRALAAVARAITLGIERKRAEESLASALRQVENIMESIPDIIYTLGMDMRLTRWNRKAEAVTGFSFDEAHQRLAVDFFPPEERATIGEAVRHAFAEGYAEVEGHLLRKDGSRVPYHWTAVPLKDGDGTIVGLTGVGRNITERKEAERSLSQLSTRLLQLQDEERRRIGRQLHDSTAQNLAALAMNLALISKSRAALDAKSRKALSDSMALAERCSQEIRTISYLLHPPLLDEMGLASAVRWYADGFARRSGLHVDVKLSPDLGRLPQEIEMTLFLVLQESLTNVHRHAESPTASIEILRQPTAITLEVGDAGRGMTPEILDACRGSGAGLGVGIISIRERMRQLGGQLDIQSGRRGTTVTAVLPLVGTRFRSSPSYEQHRQTQT